MNLRRKEKIFKNSLHVDSTLGGAQSRGDSERATSFPTVDVGPSQSVDLEHQPGLAGALLVDLSEATDELEPEHGVGFVANG